MNIQELMQIIQSELDNGIITNETKVMLSVRTCPSIPIIGAMVGSAVVGAYPDMTEDERSQIPCLYMETEWMAAKQLGIRFIGDRFA